MNKKEILNGNKVILKFMGFKFCNDYKESFKDGYFYLDDEDGRNIVTLKECDYNLDLMQKSHHLNIIQSAWLHDTIEDCRVTYNDIKQRFGEVVAEIVYAVTNEKGKNRAERANDKYYEGIRATQFASFVKMCDRLANAQYSKETNSRMFQVYRSENESFLQKLFTEPVGNFGDIAMIDELRKIYNYSRTRMVFNRNNLINYAE